MTFHEVDTKSVLNRVRGMPFDWSINSNYVARIMASLAAARRRAWQRHGRPHTPMASRGEPEDRRPPFTTDAAVVPVSHTGTRGEVAARQQLALW